VFGRYAKPGAGSAIITGNLAGKPYSQTVSLNLSESASAPAIPTLWARNTIERITFEKGVQQDQPSTIADKRIENLGLQFGLMTEFTSFVAVESKVVNIGGRQQTVEVPIETPQGVADQDVMPDLANVRLGFSPAAGGGGFGGGSGGVGGGLYRGGPGGGYPATAAPPVFASKAAPARNFGTGSSGDYAKRKAEIPSKIDRRLRGKKGLLKVQVLVTKLDAKTLAELKDSNLEVTGKDAGLKVVFGRIDAADMEWLARLTFITSIRPMKG
jgi:Ca-activated chloride channel family protein